MKHWDRSRIIRHTSQTPRRPRSAKRETVPSPRLTRACSRQGKPEALEIESDLMKLAAVTQWMRPRGASPTCLKPSQPGRSKLHVPAQQWACEAGGSEEAGRVMEPRNMYSRGQQDSLSGIEAKADGLHAPEGSNPVCDTGECTGHHRGLRAGHVFRGVTRELGRTTCLRAQRPDWGTG